MILRRWPRSYAVIGARLAFVVGVVALIELLCRIGVINRITMIPPSEMAVALWRILVSGRFNRDIGFTAYNIIAAFGLAIVVGFLIGGALHAVPRLRRASDPLLSAYYAVPTFVFYPLLIVAFGVGRTALIVMGATFGIVVMIVETMLGLDHVPAVVVKTARLMGIGPVRRFFLVTMPSAMPHLVTGIKLAVAYSVIGVVAGEFILATEGVGKRISDAYNNFDNRTMYGLLLLLLIAVTIVNVALSWWEKRLHRRFGLR
ncbi:MAG: ABC transporter permease [Stellaceae bacterium]